MKTYFEYSLSTSPFDADIISSFIWELSPEGIVEEETKLIIYSQTKIENEVSELMVSLINKKVIEDFSLDEDELEEKNWNEEWENNLEIIHVSEKIIIKPSNKDYVKSDDQIVITINPKMSFGTGEHQTTKLCLLALDKYVKKNQKVLDVGSGTGVLAIASVLMGAEKSFAVDNDEWCYENGIENSEINSVKEKVTFIIGEINDCQESDFDLVVANIQRNILLQIKNELKKKLKSDGILILSGLLDIDFDIIKPSYEEIGFQFIEKNQMNEWISISFKLM
ncbi:MAG: 50S ribosomal protein L11 methyltransferase [Chlorobiaceae bacterium]|nr:50S ribosomal protein L11 methyltransferase [Chlorobiaceae bacterium]MBA4310017.1 50S ribosomal protein L11 methyltransferase [Chlorobiaceae bacterium]